MLGTTISHYRVLEKLGEGGMGVVYRAEDTRLGRQVAIKFLNDEVLTHPSSLPRFLKEARTVSALNHPGICTLHDIGEHDGRPFLVMELLEGETLAARLTSGRLQWSEVVAVATQICDALDAAHARGIVHRDVKPGNVFLTRAGAVKLLDFGIATAMKSEAVTATMGRMPAASPLTLDGSVVGTLAYIAPEQARGEAVDGRTDIFSLGAVIFEMVTGRRAFPGPPAAALDAVLHRDPLCDAPGLPAELAAALGRALEKDPDLRYQRVVQLRDDLRRSSGDPTAGAARADAVELRSESASTRVTDGDLSVATTTPTPFRARRLAASTWVVLALLAAVSIAVATVLWTRNSGARPLDSLAVLPFENATGEEQMEYLSDGLTVSLINRLSDLPQIQVRSRSSSFRFKGRPADPQAVGRELDVAGVLSGSVGLQGDRLLVSVELVETATANQLWGTRFTRLPADLLALEDEIAKSIAAELQPRLTAADERRLARRDTRDREAYDLYLRGDFEASKFTESALYDAIDYYKRALVIDPGYVLAHTGMAHAYFWLTDWYAPTGDAAIPSLEASRAALRLDERAAPAHGLAGLVEFIYRWDWAAAERDFKRALEIDPAEGRSRAYYAWFLAAQGRRNEATREAARAEQIEPLSSEIVTVCGLALYLAGRYEEAAAAERRVIAFDPQFVWSHIILGRTLLALGRSTDALTSLERAYELEPTLPEAVAALAQGRAAVGREPDARATLAELMQLSTRRHVGPLDVATIHAALGEDDEALRWLEQAFEQRSYLLSSVAGLPFFDRLRDQPRFQSLLVRLRLPQTAERAPA